MLGPLVALERRAIHHRGPEQRTPPLGCDRDVEEWKMCLAPLDPIVQVHEEGVQAGTPRRGHRGVLIVMRLVELTLLIPEYLLVQVEKTNQCGGKTVGELAYGGGEHGKANGKCGGREGGG